MKSLLLCVLVPVAFFAVGQTPQPRLHVGVSIGSSRILNMPETGTGLNINLLNAGYSISKGFGITAKWMGAAHAPFTTGTLKREINYGALMFGPIYSLKVSEAFTLDLKGLAGVFYFREKSSFKSLDPNDPSLGVALRYNITRYFYTCIHTDFISGYGSTFF
jgi:hypothetical protein